MMRPILAGVALKRRTFCSAQSLGPLQKAAPNLGMCEVLSNLSLTLSWTG